jgi:pimeloyl-ACP methyl ester carboxylesterase
MNLRHLILVLTFAAFSCACAQENVNDSGDLQFTEVSGVEIAYRVKGEGEPVLLIPAVIADSFVLMMEEPTLDGYQLVTLHLPGQGRSGDLEGPRTVASLADIMAGLLRHLGIEQAHFVGHSSGSIGAIATAVTYPELVSSLVLLEPPALPYDGFDQQEAFAEHASEMDDPPGQGPTAFMRSEEPRPLGETVDLFMTWIADDPNWEELLSPSIPDVRAQATRALGRSGGGQPTFQRADLERISQPTLWVWSDERLGINVVAYHQLSELFPHMETEYVSGVKHGLQLLAPNRVAEVVATFFQHHPIN